ncbi:hypothetical protein EJ377_14880 [Chryseobacterium arthrosphaerae]|uniref:Uncharacterized protein n=1 Tax=Chryseobacterium arthrosphaerae TaxID=651561 RepID=A0A3S0PNE3_9FLAO|nr:hypothetical protein EJ377_14880 [Chryseobacterium arthrosphaerae]
MAGNTTPLKFGPSTSSPTTYTLADLTTWFNAKGNTILASTADVKLAGAWALPDYSKLYTYCRFSIINRWCLY